MEQGLGASIVAISGAILRDEYSRERVGLMIGIFISTVSAGTLCGTTVSGLVVDHLPWRMLFVLGAIPIAVSLVLVRVRVRESPPVAQARLDIRGAVLLIASLVSLLLVLTEGNAWGWGSPRLLGLAAGCLVLFAVWVRSELRAEEPMLDLHMLVRRPVLLANCCVLFSTGSIFGLLTLVPRFAQTDPELAGYGFGLSATLASLIFLPGFVVGFAAGPAGGAVGARTGSKWPLAVASFLIAAGAAIVAAWHAHPWEIVVGTFVALATWPAVTAAGMTVILKVVRPAETGVAAGMNLVFRQVGGAVGVQTTAAILSSSHAAGVALPSEGAFVAAFALVAVSAFVGALLAPFIAAGRSAPVTAAEAAA
jgi:predicted MFS family arabinose efflux permease